MAELTLKLTVDPATGKKTLVADYHSDADALPMEHEENHRRLVRQVIEGAPLESDALEVSRDSEAAPELGSNDSPAAGEAIELAEE